jgi:cytochrome c biogenesis protein CcmG/thiol:disulfide interchange protein DsbE
MVASDRPTPVATPNLTAQPQSTPSSAWTARVWALGTLVVIGLLLALMVWGLNRRAAGSSGMVESNRPAPTFALTSFDGQPLRIGGAGTPTIVNFWASWCVPCEQEAPILERAHRRAGDRVRIVGIAVQDTDVNARAFVRRFGQTFPNARDASGEISIEFGLSGVPETYVIDARGAIIRKWLGPVDDERLRELIELAQR